MEELEEVFISYSHDSVDHAFRVLELSNRLRSEGVDCVLDQYEISPPEGWPRWMDKKIKDASFVILICTNNYYKRVMGEEESGIGLGIKWEGNLIYQHLYNAGAANLKFIPVVFDESDVNNIPTPLMGSTRYCLATDSGYQDLYRHLTNQPKAEKPKLGKRRALPKKTAKTMFFSSPINPELWDAARWKAIFFAVQNEKPPIMGIAFEDEASARKIFEEWRERYGHSDQYEELYVSIIEGPISGKEPGYSVHITLDHESFIRHIRELGYSYDISDNDNTLITLSRIHRMNPDPGSNYLENFKKQYIKHKTYFLIPGVYLENGTVKPICELGIFKGNIRFKHVTEIGSNDTDSIVINGN